MMAFTLSLFAAVTIQKNTRDEEQVRKLITPVTGFNNNSGINIDKEVNSQPDSGKSLFGSVKSKMEGNE